jgi:hypothetical protein
MNLSPFTFFIRDVPGQSSQCESLDWKQQFLTFRKRYGTIKAMNSQRALKIRVYSTSEQVIILNKILGYCRFLYKHVLVGWISIDKVLEADKKALFACQYTTKQEYNALCEFLTAVDAFALQPVRRGFEIVNANALKWLKGIHNGEAVEFPRFKAKKDCKDTYRIGMVVSVDLDH